eukprot:2041343-Pyramimonas_sp.AAC.1
MSLPLPSFAVSWEMPTSSFQSRSCFVICASSRRSVDAHFANFRSYARPSTASGAAKMPSRLEESGAFGPRRTAASTSRSQRARWSTTAQSA